MSEVVKVVVQLARPGSSHALTGPQPALGISEGCQGSDQRLEEQET